MGYLIYLQKSFLRDPKRHISFFVAVTCSFILPLLISVYRDSSAYGMEQYLLDKTKGVTYHISNADEDDMAYFENIPGLSSPAFDEGIIYLSILSDEEWKNKETVVFYDNLIQKQAALSGNERLIISGYNYENAHGISTDTGGYLSAQKLLLIINLFIILISSFAIQSAYKSHLNQFSSDMGKLVSLGAETKHIAMIFAFEFAAIFCMASVCSVFVSVGMMKFLLGSFLEMQNVKELSWLLFHVEPQNIFLHLFLFFVSFAAVFFFTIKKYARCSVFEIIHRQTNENFKKHKYKRFKILSSPSASLARLWRQRTNKTFNSCLLTSVPIVTVFMIVFSGIMIGFDSLKTESEYDIRLSINDAETFGGFAPEDVNLIKGISGVEAISAEYEIPPDKYTVVSDDPSAIPLPVRILRYSDLDSAKTPLSEHEIAVCKNQNLSSYSIGDTLEIGLSDHYSESSGIVSLSLLVTEFTDAKSADWAVDIYLSDSFYEKIISMEPINIIEIKLTDPSASSHVQSVLQTYFPGAKYEITNHQETVDAVLYTSPGIYLLILFLFFIIFLFVTVILYAKLSDYIENSRGIIRSLYTIGASIRDIRLSYIKQDIKAAFCACVIPLLFCVPFIMLASDSFDIIETFLIKVLPFYMIMALFIIAAYIHPVYRTLKNVMKRI